MRIPSNQNWKQPNLSDLFGPLAATRNITLDEPGYARLSARAVRLKSEEDDDDFGLPLAFGRKAQGEFFLATSDKAWIVNINSQTLSIVEESGTGAPTLALDSEGIWWRNRWYVSKATSVAYRTIASDTYTTQSNITLTSGKRHPMVVMETLNRLLVGDGNRVEGVDTSDNAITALVLPEKFEVIGLAYNNGKAGIITRLGDDSDSQGAEAYFFTWDGSTAEANQGVGIGAVAALAESAYKSTYLLFLKDGRVIYWLGGGFQDLGYFPFYSGPENQPSASQSLSSFGKSMIPLTSTRVLMNASTALSNKGVLQEQYIREAPSGVYCMDQDAGLYHRFSPSISPVSLLVVNDGNVNFSTNVLTRSSGTVPPTGSIAMYMHDTGAAALGGLQKNKHYFVIKTGATTFKLAESAAKAAEGVAIDLTGAATGGNASFYVIELHDFGQTFFDRTGAVAAFGEQTPQYRDIIFGAELLSKDGADSYYTLCMIMPFLENRGDLIFSRILADGVEDLGKELVVKFRPLGPEDAIVVKQKPRDVYGLPVSTPQESFAGETDQAAWNSPMSFVSYANLAAAKEYLEEETGDGVSNELEVFITAGAGAGASVPISQIDYDATTGAYAITVSEAVIGAQTGRSSHFIIDNWHLCRTITAEDVKENRQGFATVEVNNSSKRQIFKIELRGYGTTIETTDFQKDVEQESE